MEVKPRTSKSEDEAWIEEQFAADFGPEDGYSDAQFEADVERAAPALDRLAQKAQEAMENGTALKFPR